MSIQEDDGSPAGAAPIAPAQTSPAAIATAIVEWDRRGRLVDDEAYVQNNAPAVADAFCHLLVQLRNMTMLFRLALLCTSVEIARQARPHLDAADAVIAKATKGPPLRANSKSPSQT